MNAPAESSGQVRDSRSYLENALAAERRCGVLPLLDLFDADPDGLVVSVRDGRLIAGLGLFTPNALLDWTDPTVRARREGDHVVLDGRFRIVDERADVSLVLVALEGRLHLALLPHRYGGVRVSGIWGEVADASLRTDSLSQPVSWAAGGPLARVFENYAWEFVGEATAWSATVIADLRRALTAVPSEEPFSTSQYLAHELTRLEIEVLHAGTAARLGDAFQAEPAGGEAVVAVLLSATDLVRRTVVVAEDLTTELGLRASPVTDGRWPGSAVGLFFGGRRMVERELARRMGLPSGVPGR
ncbi:hypothetical protein [Actinophytocola sediminis]